MGCKTRDGGELRKCKRVGDGTNSLFYWMANPIVLLTRRLID